MTLPDERARAIINLGNEVAAMRGYAVRKTGNQKFAKVPVAVIESLLMRLRHYPATYDLEELAKARPDILRMP